MYYHALSFARQPRQWKGSRRNGILTDDGTNSRLYSAVLQKNVGGQESSSFAS